MRIAVFGAGAAGFFAAVNAARQHPAARVTLYEKSDKVLSKVRISGGGRCNVTHDQREIRKLARNYPRGERFLRQAFKQFSVDDTIAWFANEGVTLKTEVDGRMFPTTDDSSTIIHALEGAASRAGVRVCLRSGLRVLDKRNDGIFVATMGNGTVEADRVIMTTGGHPGTASYERLARLGHTIVPPVPSLFTFNIPDDPIRDLMGIALNTRLRVVGTDIETTGPVLITHWGLSGPAVLRASAWGSRLLHERGHRFTVRVNWLGGSSEEEVRRVLADEGTAMDRKLATNADPFKLPRRFWEHQLAKAGIEGSKPWSAVAKKERNRLIDLLTNDRFEVHGKTTFKEEFVTAGGVDLAEVDPRTLQSCKVPGLYFAGEVLDIDGITGGFNFQAAWTTGHIAGKLGS